MESRLKKRHISRDRRIKRVRKKLRGTEDMPRLCVSKSNKNIFVQLIDDEKGISLAAAGTLGEKTKISKELAKKVGIKIAKAAVEKNIKRVVFDRGRYKYHGLIALLADGAREGGLEF